MARVQLNGDAAPASGIEYPYPVGTSTANTERRLTVAKDAVSGLGDKAYESFKEVFEDMAEKHEDEVWPFYCGKIGW